MNIYSDAINEINIEMVRELLPKFPDSANKSNRGRLFSLCSSYGMPGASILSAKAAIKSGLGLLDMAVIRENYQIVASHVLEPIFKILDSNEVGTYSYEENKDKIKCSIEKADACLIGCGLKVSDDTEKLVCKIIKNTKIPMIIDADGINIVAKDINILKTAIAPIVLTPHPGEMARLLGVSSSEVQSDRYNIAREFATRYNVVLVLKGANTLVALPNGKVYLNKIVNNGLSKGGSGDVLAGILASLLAQGLKPSKAAICAVFIHGMAGCICAEKFSKTSMTPTDIIDELYSLFLKIEK